MHSLWARSNSVFTTASTLIFFVCALTSLTDMFHVAEPKVELELLKVKSLVKGRRDRADEATLNLFLDADLRSVFSWNTKQIFLYVQAVYETPENQLNQVVLWDAIIVDKESAIVKRKLRQEYQFDDDGSNLRDLDFNLTVVWNVMPKVGGLYTNSKSFSNFKMPVAYT